jgi:cytochrome c biogenesis protein CcmG, thiol:disulfide interchange protein DsbE
VDYRKIGLGVIALVVVGVVAWAVVSRLGGGDSSGASGEAVSYSGETLDGQTIDLESYKGKPVVLNFWATWCGYCVQEMPDLVKFAAAHPEVSVIGVNVNDNKNDAVTFVAQQGMKFPVIYDPNAGFFDQFASQGLPTTVFLDKDLQVTDKIVGATDTAGFEAGLQTAQ